MKRLLLAIGLCAGTFYCAGDTNSPWRNFPPVPVKEGAEFSFVQVTDVHVSQDKDNPVTFAKDIADINALPQRPSFVVVTGDLVNTGSNTPSHALYAEEAKAFQMPYCDVVGNHDTYLSTVEAYCERHGPDYYAFDLGGRHFIALNCLAPGRWTAWLKQDLEAQPKGREIFVFQHYQPDQALLDTLAKYNVKALFYGHWHANKTFRHGGMLVVSTPPLRFGGLDGSLRGFRTVTLGKHGDVRVDYRWGGMRRQLRTMVAEVGRPGSVRLIAAAYDTAQDVNAAFYQVDGGRWHSMRHVGGWIWNADLRLAAGTHNVRVKASAGKGESWQTEKDFSLGPQAARLPVLKWQAYAGGLTGWSDPVLAGDRLYIGIQDDNDAAAGGVVCLDARTGRQVWRFVSGDSVKGAPAVANGMVCAISVTGSFFGLDAVSGKEVWRSNLGEVNARWVYSSPVIADGVVYGGTAPCLVALDLKTGRELWRHTEPGGDWMGLGTPAVDQQNVYTVCAFRPGVVALDRQSGKAVWTAKGGSSFFPLVDKDGVCFEIDGQLRFMDRSRQTPVWSVKLDDAWACCPSAMDAARIVVGGQFGKLVAFDKGTGARLWEFQSAGAIGGDVATARWSAEQTFCAPLISGDVVYAAAGDGTLYKLDGKTGQKVWECPVGVPLVSRPAASGGLVYVAAADGSLFAFADESRN